MASNLPTVTLPQVCERPVPEWPLDSYAVAADLVDTEALRTYWEQLWRSPVAEYWHSQSVHPMQVARYVVAHFLAAVSGQASMMGQAAKAEVDLLLAPSARRREGLHVPGVDPEEEAETPEETQASRAERATRIMGE